MLLLMQRLSGQVEPGAEGGEGGAATAEVEDPEVAARRAAEEAEAKRRAEEAAALELIFVKEAPLTARLYRSATAHISEGEVRDMTVSRSRPLIAVRLQRRRYLFGAACGFNDREADGPGALQQLQLQPEQQCNAVAAAASVSWGCTAIRHIQSLM